MFDGGVSWSVGVGGGEQTWRALGAPKRLWPDVFVVIEKFIVFQHCVFASPAACCCYRVSCCWFWMMKSFCLLKYSKANSIQDSPSQQYAKRR